MLILLITGWWLTLGHEGQPTFLARIFHTPDTVIHTNVGWFMAAFTGAGLLLGVRAVRTFIVESFRVNRKDGRWWLYWPRAIFTGSFARHEGHFDPGQRVVNVVLTLGLLALIGSGVGMASLHGGPVFAALVRIHKWSTYVVTPILAGHILIALGILPGYRGVWRSMHLGGKLSVDVARRLWPGWFDRHTQPKK